MKHPINVKHPILDSEPRANPNSDPAALETHRIFSILLVAFALFLLVNIPFQTTYLENIVWFKQPRTWPAMAILGLVLSSIGHLYAIRSYEKQKNEISPKFELYYLIQACKIGLIFILYVMVVKYLGYLLSSIVFATFMCWAIGYQDKKYYVTIVAVAIAIIVIFKAFLRVHIAGGIIYNFLPTYVGAFMKTYF